MKCVNENPARRPLKILSAYERALLEL